MPSVPKKTETKKSNQTKNSKQALALRVENTAIIKPKVEKAKNPEISVEKIVESLNETQKEELLFDLVKKVKTENKTTEEPILDKNVVNSSLFDKIYTQEFVEETRSVGFFGSIWQILTSQIVWRFIALGLILGSVLFYIQGLQPALVRNYRVYVDNQIEKINTRYNDQAKTFLTQEASLISSFDYSPDLFCSQIPKYTTTTADTDNLTRLKVGLFPDKTLKTLNYSYPFSLPDIDGKYNDFYTYYSKQVVKYSDQVTKLQDILNYKAYLNVWLDTCTAVEKAPNDLAALQKQCTTLALASENFVNTKPFFYDQIKSYNEKGIGLCGNLSLNNKKTFAADFTSSFASLAGFLPDFTDTNLILKNNAADFSAQKNKTISEISGIEKDKTLGTNQFYLLNYKF
jgi:hypothetical protein